MSKFKPLEISSSYQRRVETTREEMARLMIRQEEAYQELICRIGLADGSVEALKLWDYLVNDCGEIDYLPKEGVTEDVDNEGFIE